MISTIFALVTLVVGIKSCGDFYWRDYQDGAIPSDAIPAGKNSRGSVYIGQVYIHGYALAVGTIVPGDTELYVPCYGVKKGVIIKILCAHDKEKYYWLQTTAATYAQDTLQKCPVVGGYDQKQTDFPLGTLHLGRTRKHAGDIIGAIGAFRSNPNFFYPLDGKEMVESIYEVLIYTDYRVIQPQNL